MASWPTAPTAVSALPEPVRAAARQKRRDLVRAVGRKGAVGLVLVAREAQERGHAHVVGEQGLRQRLRNRRARKRIARARQRVVGPASEPAPTLCQQRIRRVPDVPGREVRKARVRITDVRDDGHALRVPERFHPGHDRIQAERAVEVQDRGDRNPDARAQCWVERVGVGHDGVQAVVAAHELEHDERAPGVGGGHGLLEPRGAGDRPARHHRGHRHESRRAQQEVASVERHRCGLLLRRAENPGT
jgi:hypothetical protein